MIRLIKEIIERYKEYPLIKHNLQICYDNSLEMISTYDRVVKDLKESTELVSSQEEKIKKLLGDKEIGYLDAEGWNNKWTKSIVKYAAPIDKYVIEYVEDKEYLEINQIAMEIIEANQIIDISLIPKIVMLWIEKERFKYKTEEKENWNDPLSTLINKDVGNDCDDIMILTYYIIRKIIQIKGLWQQNKHRLKCQDIHVFSYTNQGNILNYAGRHANLIWLGEDCEWYTIETTYYLNQAISNFHKKPQRQNNKYGLINYTFNEDYSWAQNSIIVQKDYKKII